MSIFSVNSVKWGNKEYYCIMKQKAHVLDKQENETDQKLYCQCSTDWKGSKVIDIFH